MISVNDLAQQCQNAISEPITFWFQGALPTHSSTHCCLQKPVGCISGGEAQPQGLAIWLFSKGHLSSGTHFNPKMTSFFMLTCSTWGRECSKWPAYKMVATSAVFDSYISMWSEEPQSQIHSISFSSLKPLQHPIKRRDLAQCMAVLLRRGRFLCSSPCSTIYIYISVTLTRG